MDLRAKDRIHWKCRRGLLELDLVFDKFLPQVEEKDFARLGQLLELPDNDLWDVVIGRSDAYPQHLNDLVARLRAI